MERSLALERHLLAGPQSTPNSTNQDRRIVQLKTCKTVPIGARGRKRKTVMFIGITPNPDGRQLTTPPPPALQVRQQTPGPSFRQPSNQTANEPGPSQPAKRTYRAASTPYASANHRTRARVLSFALPDESLIDLNSNEESLHVEFNETFGRLHYDTSDTE